MFKLLEGTFRSHPSESIVADWDLKTQRVLTVFLSPVGAYIAPFPSGFMDW